MENRQLTIKTDSVQDAMQLSKVFFESGMFSDIKSAAQAMVKIMAGAEIGLKSFASVTGIHIIQGKPVLGAGLIASSIKGSGKYDYRIIEMSDKLCSIEFFQGKESLGTSTFTVEDAKKAQTKNLDKFPKNMLFARSISNGVKWFCPDVFNGPVYVPGEIESDGSITEYANVVEDKRINDVDEELTELTEKLYHPKLAELRAKLQKKYGNGLEQIDPNTLTKSLDWVNDFLQPVTESQLEESKKFWSNNEFAQYASDSHLEIKQMVKGEAETYLKKLAKIYNEYLHEVENVN